MDTLNFEVDFIGVTDKQNIIKKLVSAFQLPDSSNWDSFMDWFTNLDSDSAIINSIQPIPEKVHLVVKNIEEVKKISQKEYDMLLSVLEDSTQKENRGDEIKFSYQIE